MEEKPRVRGCAMPCVFVQGTCSRSVQQRRAHPLRDGLSYGRSSRRCGRACWGAARAFCAAAWRTAPTIG